MKILPPLAERMRPNSFNYFVGQQHLIGNQSILWQIIKSNELPSLIFWGPPGSGKTTLAHLIANQLQASFYELSAINSGVKEIREIISASTFKPGSILFIDEIHRFNKGQQDALLGGVEKGIIKLIGATTENPSFEINNALLSRCQIYLLKPITEDELKQLLNYAISNDEVLSKLKINIQQTEALFRLSDGDARKLFNLLELIVLNESNKNEIHITNELVMHCAQQKIANYDKKGDQHYDIISAFIKSIRGSDPNGAVYWLSRMIDGGEDLKFISRRMVILASEDIGNANPNALVLANAAFDAVNKIGYPEANLILIQCAIYLAGSPKSNSVVVALSTAMKEIKNSGNLNVPLHLRNSPTALMKNLDYGKNYLYAHNYENNFIDQQYLPDEIKNKTFYTPGKNAREAEIEKYLKSLWKGKNGF